MPRCAARRGSQRVAASQSLIGRLSALSDIVLTSPSVTETIFLAIATRWLAGPNPRQVKVEPSRIREAAANRSASENGGP